MDWLPTSPAQPDPFGAPSEPLDSAARAQVLEVGRITLKSLHRAVAREALRSGPHDYTGAAQGAAAYCARRAAIELVRGQPGRWTGLLELYLAGHWPCGLMPGGDVVVY